MSQGISKLVVSAGVCLLKSLARRRRCATKGMGQRLVLGFRGSDRLWRWKAGALQRACSEIGEPGADGRRQLRDGLLYLRRVVIRLGLVNLRDPMYTFQSPNIWKQLRTATLT